jgi:hypothetical protein
VRKLALIAALGALLAPAGCTLHHSKQGLWAPNEPAPSAAARFVSEEDSGLALFGIFVITEPDHYAVLLERARKKHRCATIHHAQLDFFTDHWLIVAFPISRMTLVCEPEAP